ncbi:MAG: amidohydrolase [Gammaproteobacteria bacterium]|nr:amidohydrolase [Gammaproteobacteria bacterium]MDH5308693.1 amidohydrolase [Gammaproteobacteria bacterium]
MNVTIVQSELHWHNADENRDMFSRLIARIEDPTDLVVLPEMFTTGFTMDAEAHAEPMDGATVGWLRKTAASTGAAVCGSVIIRENGSFFNRFVCAEPNGVLHTYDKRHLFRLAGEDRHYVAGDRLATFALQGWRICPMICYDLRFPVWSRNRGNYDLLLYVANWPNRRHLAWETLVRARAIENLAYVAAVNRVGEDGNDLPYSGGSAVIDYLGQDLVGLGDATGYATATLDYEALLKFRDRFPFHADADDFTLRT